MKVQDLTAEFGRYQHQELALRVIVLFYASVDASIEHL